MTKKILAVLGYHYGELDWGLQVRDEYVNRYPQREGIEFYEIQNKEVMGWHKSESSEKEILEEIQRLQDVGLIIDIHKITEKFWCLPLLCYDGNDPDLIKEVMGLDTKPDGFPSIVCHLEQNRLQTGNPSIDGIPYALFDTNILDFSLEDTVLLMDKIITTHQEFWKRTYVSSEPAN